MGTEKIQIVATAQDRASPTLKRLNQNVTALGSKGRGPLGGLLSGLGGISPLAMGAGIGIGILSAALLDGVAGALAEEKQLARLEQALKANVKGWDGSTAAVEAFNGAAMDLAFSDDAARESMIRLVTASGDVEQSMTNSRLAMDIARGRNIDLATATDIVLKVNAGSTRIFKELGITIDSTSTATERLTMLQEMYAGQADVYAKTTAGKFEAAQVKVDNAMEDVGHSVIQATAGFLDFGAALEGDKQASVDFLRAAGGFIPFLNALPDAMQAGLDAMGSRGAKDSLGRSAGDVMFGNLEAEAEDAGEASANRLSGAFAATIRQREQDYKAAGDAIRENLGNLSGNIVGSLRGGGIKDIMKDLNWAINHPDKLAKFGQKLQDALANPKLQDALGSNNPFLVLAGQQAETALEGLWTSITGGADTSRSAVDQLAESIRLLGGAAPAPLFGVFGGNPYRQRAAGGDVRPGETVMVGERGPELVTAGRRGANVTANHNLGGHGHPIVLNGRMLGQAVDEYLGRQMSLAPTGVFSRG